MIGAYDRQESEADMQQAISALLLAKREFESLAEVPTPLPGSILAVEGERHTTFERIDVVSSKHRARARDNLERLFELMIDDGNARILSYPYALYSLIRTAIESAALSYWVIEPDKKASRVERCLRLTFRDTNDRYDFVASIAPASVRRAESARKTKTLTRLSELKDTVGALKQKHLSDPPRYSDILRSMSDRSRHGSPHTFAIDSPYVVWKMSSAFIHGSGQVIDILSEMRQVTEFQDGQASAEITASYQALATATLAIVRLIYRAEVRYTYLATHDHSKRPL